MKKNMRLLLVENVDNLGIVGDVVTVRAGYARNYLLPRELATEPSDELVASLAAKRADAQKHIAETRRQREVMIQKMAGLEIKLERSCNDQGILYGSVTQHDIAEALGKLGYSVRAREVRLPNVIKKVDRYDVHVKFDTDLQTDIKLNVVADRVIQSDEREEMEFDNEGNLITRPRKAKAEKAEGAEGEGAEKSEQGDQPRPERKERRDAKPERMSRAERLNRDFAADTPHKGFGMGKPADGDKSADAAKPAKAEKAKGEKKAKSKA